MSFLKNWKRKRISQKPFPAPWLKIIEQNVPLYTKLPIDDQKELQRHTLIFISEKLFEGCGGLKITDQIKLTIASQACILLLHRQTDYYPSLASILVYPHSYLAPITKYDPDGIVDEGLDVLSGESWHRGSVVLSWDDVISAPDDIHDATNVVLHEFAHQLDSNTEGDSSPILHNRSAYTEWARVLQADYDKLRQDIDRHHPTFLDEYAAENLAEFFAVATEYFFEKPKELKSHHPQLYHQLNLLYQQDPAEL